MNTEYSFVESVLALCANATIIDSRANGSTRIEQASIDDVEF